MAIIMTQTLTITATSMPVRFGSAASEYVTPIATVADASLSRLLLPAILRLTNSTGAAN